MRQLFFLAVCSVLIGNSLVSSRSVAQAQQANQGPRAVPDKPAQDKPAQDKPAQDGAGGPTLVYREPFETLSSAESASKLIVFLITDEDPFVWTEARRAAADKNRLGGGPDLWCGWQFRRTYLKMLDRRLDLKDRCLAQRIVAGHPALLLGGNPKTTPHRVIIAVCDGNYRLLSFCVGLPNADELIALIEDAEECQTLLKLHEEDEAALGKALSQRASERIQRVYLQPLAETAEEHGWDPLVGIDPPWIENYMHVVSDIQPVYLADVKLRFGLQSASDLVRLIVLEQHIETRRDWGNVISPFVVGRPFQSMLSPLVGSIWNLAPVWRTDEESNEELLAWFRSHREQSVITLAIAPSPLDRQRPWPPPLINSKKNVGRDWGALEQAMANHPYRTVDPEELAVLLQQEKHLPLHLNRPARARYLFFEPDKDMAFVIREGENPAKYIKRFDK